MTLVTGARMKELLAGRGATPSANEQRALARHKLWLQRSNAAKQAVITKRLRYSTWPTRRGDHLDINMPWFVINKKSRMVLAMFWLCDDAHDYVMEKCNELVQATQAPLNCLTMRNSGVMYLKSTRRTV